MKNSKININRRSFDPLFNIVPKVQKIHFFALRYQNHFVHYTNSITRVKEFLTRSINFKGRRNINIGLKRLTLNELVARGPI